MASRIIAVAEEEKIPLYFGEPEDPDHSILYYRRIPARKRREVLDKHTTMGVTNWYAAGLAMVEYSIVGWHNIPDATGTLLPFRTDLVGYLPDDAVSAVLVKLNENAPTSFFGM